MHDYDITETNDIIVNNGLSDYRILFPAGKKNNKFIATAVNDLKRFIAEATGAELTAVEDSAELKGGKFLSVGDTALAKGALLLAESKLTKCGFYIKTVGHSVLMAGATDEASMYAVYAFLRTCLNFEQYFTDFYTLDKTPVLKLKNYNVTDIPDFEYRIQSAGFIRWNEQNIRRMCWTDNSELYIPVDEDKAVWHNSFIYLPPAIYNDEPNKYKEQIKDVKEKIAAVSVDHNELLSLQEQKIKLEAALTVATKNYHPEWYNDSCNQLCYTAHGKALSRAEMVEKVAARIKELFSMEKYKNYDWLTVSIQDNQNCCECDTCKAEKAKYGADSAVIVKFLNDVAKNVTAWMETKEGRPYKREKYRIHFFAYHATNAAPAKWDSSLNKYVPVSADVICDEHIVPYFAETNGDYTQNFSDKGTANTVVGDNMRAWGALSKEIYFWSYSTNFSHFLTPYNSFDAVQSILKFAKNNGCRLAMIQDQWIQKNAETGFGIFKNWLHSKLMWNVNANVEQLTDQFFNAYFKDAALNMRSLFENWRALARHQTNELGYKGYRSVYFNALDKKLWPQETLVNWLKKIEQAKCDIKKYSSIDNKLYRELSEHICIESLSYRYLLITLYGDSYPEKELIQMKKEFAADAKRIGINLVNSMYLKTIDDLCAKWGV